MVTQLVKLLFCLNLYISPEACVALKGPDRIRVTWKAPNHDSQSPFR